MVSKIQIVTSYNKQLIDITDKVEKFVKKLNNDEGLACIFVKHTTCAVIISEAEDSLEKDIFRYLKNYSPKGSFEHSHGDVSHTPAHILSAIIGPSAVIPVQKKVLQLGTWQKICLLELNGPREREVIVQILP